MIGCLFTGACFILVILAGVTANPTTLRSAVMLFGLGSGILTNSAVSASCLISQRQKRRARLTARGA